MTRHDPLTPVRHMRDHAREAYEMARNRSRGDLDTDRMLNLSMTRLMEIVGEAATRVSDELRIRYPEVPWRDVSDLRNRLIHGYDTVNCDILWNILQDDLPPLIEQLEMILAEES